MNGLAGADVLAQHLNNGVHCCIVAFLGEFRILGDLCDALVNTPLEIHQSLCDGRVQGNHRAGTVGLATHGAELKAVSRESEGAGAVAVGVVNEQFGYLGNVDLHALLASDHEEVFFVGLLNMVEQLAHLTAEETGDDGRRCFVGA